MISKFIVLLHCLYHYFLVSRRNCSFAFLPRHFDPNNSGSVHYGEFCWAFFNRRSLITQWKQNTRTLNDRQIKTKLQLADRNGNGILSRKEFARLLKSFSIKLSDMEIDLLIDRFDKDGDGELDLAEFTAFINAEVNPQLSGNSSSNKLSNNVSTINGKQRGLTSSSNVAHQGTHGVGRISVAEGADERREEENSSFNDDPPSFEDDNDNIDRTAEVRFHMKESSGRSGLSDTDNTALADYAKSGSIRIADVINPAEMSQIFAHQAKIEAKLGGKYFK
jgi:hypothetical protein